MAGAAATEAAAAGEEEAGAEVEAATTTATTTPGRVPLTLVGGPWRRPPPTMTWVSLLPAQAFCGGQEGPEADG